MERRVVQLPTGAWYSPVPESSASGTRRNSLPFCAAGNPNVLTRDAGTSRLAQGSAAQTCLVDAERFDGALPPLAALTPPVVQTADESLTLRRYLPSFGVVALYAVQQTAGSTKTRANPCIRLGKITAKIFSPSGGAAIIAILGLTHSRNEVRTRLVLGLTVVMMAAERRRRHSVSFHGTDRRRLAHGQPRRRLLGIAERLPISTPAVMPATTPTASAPAKSAISPGFRLSPDPGRVDRASVDGMGIDRHACWRQLRLLMTKPSRSPPPLAWSSILSAHSTARRRSQSWPCVMGTITVRVMITAHAHAQRSRSGRARTS